MPITNKFIRAISRVEVAAPLLALGAAILLTRVVIMLAQGALGILVDWVGILLILEGAIDIGCLIAALRWWATRQAGHLLQPLRLGAGAAILHAFRVLIFVLGRTPPLLNFDVRPEHWATHASRWSWFGVYFAAIIPSFERHHLYSGPVIGNTADRIFTRLIPE